MRKAKKIFIDQTVGNKIAFFKIYFKTLFLILLINGKFFFRKNTFCKQFIYNG